MFGDSNEFSSLIDVLVEMHWDYINNPESNITADNIISFVNIELGYECYTWEDVIFYIDRYYE